MSLQARKQRERAEREEAQERAAQRAEELQEELRADAERQQVERERRQRARKRAVSDATEVPPLFEDFVEVTPTESFTQVIEWENIAFNVVKLFHPHKGSLFWVQVPIIHADVAFRDPRDLVAS